MQNQSLVRLVKDTAKAPYAWPGGYPKMAFTSDGGCLCCRCLREEFPRIARSTRDAANDGFTVSAVSINWEDTDLHCDHCSATIESAYEE